MQAGSSPAKHHTDSLSTARNNTQNVWTEAIGAVQEHCGIESQLHWVADVILGEDACLIYHGDDASNLATVLLLV
jgi:predicted transposase YbfD/YdcC